MPDFKIKSDFKPAGDQPQAIEQLFRGVSANERRQTLLGVTGSGKTFTMANVIVRYNRPTLVISPNKILAAQLYAKSSAMRLVSVVTRTLSFLATRS